LPYGYKTKDHKGAGVETFRQAKAFPGRIVNGL
jgi:hypothetical protein